MSPADHLRRIFLRWSQLGLLGVLLLPFAVACVLGFVWLFERGWLLVFVAATVVLILLARGARLLARWQRRRVPASTDADTPPEAAATGKPTAMATGRRGSARPPPDPEWSEADTEAWRRACARAEARLQTPRPWEDMPAEALAVIESVAADLSGGRRGALDFTLPEALLLIDRVALRYRAFLRRNVPFSDQLPVRGIWWAWQQRQRAQAAWDSGYLVWRGVRLMVNPAVGVLREIERIAAAGLQARLTDQMQRDAQLALLEEVAIAAVDLYSGRLRFSDAELLELDLDSTGRDRAMLARSDEPLRVLVVGQISAGKSTLINALLRRNAAETDAAPTTDRATVHAAEIDGTPVHLIDTPGIDGGAAGNAALLAEMRDADLLLWVVRANRSGRDADARLMAAFRDACAGEPQRRAPGVVAVASAAELVLPGWPYPENRLPEEAADRLGRAMAVIGADMGVVPVPVRAEPPEWNLEAVEAALAAALPEALMVQRNRRRREGARGGMRLMENLRRAGRGARAGASMLTRGIRRRGGE